MRVYNDTSTLPAKMRIFPPEVWFQCSFVAFTTKCLWQESRVLVLSLYVSYLWNLRKIYILFGFSVTKVKAKSTYMIFKILTVYLERNGICGRMEESIVQFLIHFPSRPCLSFISYLAFLCYSTGQKRGHKNVGFSSRRLENNWTE